MAKASAMARPAAPPAPGEAGMDDDDAASPGMDEGADEGGEDDNDVLLTVLKEADGTYRLIEGDEDDEAEGGEGGSDESEGKTYDSKGALLKAILDVLNEDESSEGAEGGSEDQFQSGYNENAPAKPAAPMPQKY